MIIPGKNCVQNSNFCLLGWNIRASLGQNYNQGNLCGVGSVRFILLNSVFYNSTNSSYYGSWQHLLPYHMLSGIWVVKLHANSSSLPLSVFRSFFHYLYMYDVREIVWWRSLQKDKIILSTTQPLDYLAVSASKRWKGKELKRTEFMLTCLIKELFPPMFGPVIIIQRLSFTWK